MKTRLFPEMQASDMTVIDRKIHDLLKAEGYGVTGSERITGMKFNGGLNVNRLEYQRGARERVFVITHEPPEAESCTA